MRLMSARRPDESNVAWTWTVPNRFLVASPLTTVSSAGAGVGACDVGDVDGATVAEVVAAGAAVVEDPAEGLFTEA